LGPKAPLIQWVLGPFSSGYSDNILKMITHVYLVLRLRNEQSLISAPCIHSWCEQRQLYPFSFTTYRTRDRRGSSPTFTRSGVSAYPKSYLQENDNSPFTSIYVSANSQEPTTIVFMNHLEVFGCSSNSGVLITIYFLLSRLQFHAMLLGLCLSFVVI